MQYDFDTVYDRRHSNSIKWDFVGENSSLRPRDLKAESEILPMWLSDMDFALPPPIIDALVSRAQHGIFGYTLPTEAYYEVIINWVRRRTGWLVQRDWIITNHGVMPAMNMAIQTFTKPDDKVIVQTPVFHPFAQSIINNGRVAVRNPLSYTKGRYEMDFDDLVSKLADPKTKMILLCSPHNPVGRVWNRDELYRLGQLCQMHDVLIVCDEIHSDLTYSWVRFTTFGMVDETFNGRLILCTGPSKAFNMPGLKTSLTIIPNPALRESFLMTMRNLNELFSMNIFGTLALQTAYEKGEAWLEQLMAYLEANLQYLQDFLGQYCPQLRVVQPEALYLIWLDCRTLGLDPTALQQLFYDRAGVYLEQGITYGQEGAGYMRINIACPRTTLEMALNRIRRALEAYVG